MNGIIFQCGSLLADFPVSSKAAWIPVVLLLAIGYKHRSTAPIFYGIPPGSRVVDPVVQALTLTDIVVSVTVVALILSLALDIHEQAKTIDPEEIVEVSG